MYYYKYIYIYIDIYLFNYLEKNIGSRVISGIFLHIPPSISKLSSVICHCTIIFPLMFLSPFIFSLYLCTQ
jgi:hypothetical protein